MSRTLNILLLVHDSSRHIGTVDDHIAALENNSGHYVTVFDCFAAGRLDLDLSYFDIVVLHYSLVISMTAYVSPNLAVKLIAFKGLKVLFIQDEYRWINRTAEAIRQLEIDVIFTVLNSDVIHRVYYHHWFNRIRIEQTLTGFVPEHLRTIETPPYTERLIDVGYRARKLSAWFGSFGREKWLIGERFSKAAPGYGLRCDISSEEADRLYGQDWIRFLSNCKAVLGTESGTSFCDFDGSIQSNVESYEALHPEVRFEEVRDLFLGDKDGDIVIHVISPRCFEAASLRTLMIMYPGEYSGIFQPWRHYVPLQRDHSNMDEVVAVLRDPARAGKIIDNAYREIACSDRWTLNSFVAHFDRVMNEEIDAATARRQAYIQVRPAQIAAHIETKQRQAQWYRYQQEMIRAMNQIAVRVMGSLLMFSQRLPSPFARLAYRLIRWFFYRIKNIAKRILGRA